MSPAKIPVVVAGTGHGLRVLVPALREAQFEVTALVGTNPERTERRAAASEIPAAYTELDKAIVDTKAKAVVVATPPQTHSELVHCAINRGCHVLCEKPFSLDAEEGQKMLDAAERAGIVHFMGNQFRMQPDRSVVARAIKKGDIGEPRMVTLSQFINLVADPEGKRPVWWFNKEAGGGWLGASGSHQIDMIRTWLGEFESVSASLINVSKRPEGSAEDTFITRFTMQNGVEGLIMQSGGTWGGISNFTHVAGTDGTLALEDNRVMLSDRAGTRELQPDSDLLLPEMEASDDPRKMFLHIELPPAIRLCNIWRNAINGKSLGSVPPATFADGLATIRVIDAIRRSAEQGGAVVQVSVN